MRNGLHRPHGQNIAVICACPIWLHSDFEMPACLSFSHLSYWAHQHLNVVLENVKTELNRDERTSYLISHWWWIMLVDFRCYMQEKECENLTFNVRVQKRPHAFTKNNTVVCICVRVCVCECVWVFLRWISGAQMMLNQSLPNKEVTSRKHLWC